MIRILSVRIITRKVRDADTITEKKVPAAIMERAETAAVIIVIENSSCIQTEYPGMQEELFFARPRGRGSSRGQSQERLYAILLLRNLPFRKKPAGSHERVLDYFLGPQSFTACFTRHIKAGVKSIEILGIQIFLNRAEHFSETLEVDNLSWRGGTG